MLALYLRRLQDRLPRQLSLSLSGWHLLLMTLLIGFLAIQYGHQLFFALFCMLLSLIVVSGLLSESALQKISVDLLLPKDFTAHRQGQIFLQLKHHGRYLPAYAIELTLMAEPLSAMALPLTTKAFCLRLAAQNQQWYTLSAVFHRRGHVQWRRLQIATAYPFGFFKKSRWIFFENKYSLILPEFSFLPDKAVRIRKAADRSFASQPQHRLDLAGFKNYASGDDMRHIAWLRSMLQGQLLLKQYDDLLIDRPILCLLSLKTDALTVTEPAISCLRSLCEMFWRKNLNVGIWSAALYVKPAKGFWQRQRCLKGLALLDTKQPLPTVATNTSSWLKIAVVGPGCSMPKEAQASCNYTMLSSLFSSSSAAFLEKKQAMQ